MCALAIAQVEAARTARMYGLGVLLAGLTAWLLLRACRADERRWFWWAGYGVAAAAFCYAHNYAFFTLFGQGAFVLAALVFWRDKLGGAGPWSVALGFGYATLLAFILYLPWLPVVLEQIRQVRLSFWIEQPSLATVQRTLFTWSAGTTYQGQAVARLWLAVAGVAVVWALWRSALPATFFLIQAFAPFVFSITLSMASGRSIFYEHYLVFGNLFWLGFLGLVVDRLPGWPERLTVGTVLLAAAATGLVEVLAELPAQPPAVAQAAGFLTEHARPGDEVWASNAWELNRLRYYLSQAGSTDLKVRCHHSFAGEGHMIHIASLRAEEVIWRQEAEALPGRLWVAGKSQAFAPLEMELVREEKFDAGRDYYTLVLARRAR